MGRNTMRSSINNAMRQRLFTEYLNEKEMKTTKEKVTEQVKMQEEIQSLTGINIVNCGDCGSVVLHKINNEHITCPYCDFTSEPCDFPDFLYSGLENSEQFNKTI